MSYFVIAVILFIFTDIYLRQGRAESLRRILDVQYEALYKALSDKGLISEKESDEAYIAVLRNKSAEYYKILKKDFRNISGVDIDKWKK